MKRGTDDCLGVRLSGSWTPSAGLKGAPVLGDSAGRVPPVRRSAYADRLPLIFRSGEGGDGRPQGPVPKFSVDDRLSVSRQDRDQ